MDAQVTLRPARREDVGFMAALHAESFSGLLSARLGPAYLASFYGALVSARGGGCFVADLRGVPAGFICGSCEPLSSLGAAPALVRAVVTGAIAPGELPAILRYRRWAAGARLAAELVSLAVSPAARGKGAGTALVEELCRFFRGRGVGEFCAFTSDLYRALFDFYPKLGFEHLSEYSHGGDRTICLRKVLR